MSSWKVSAQFAAFVWYSEQNPEKAKKDASFFAKRNWVAFLPCAHAGVGRLLMKIASPNAPEVPDTRPNAPETRRRKKSPPGKLRAVG
jgi:hypothetical protein